MMCSALRTVKGRMHGFVITLFAVSLSPCRVLFHVKITRTTRRFTDQPEDGFKCEERVLYYMYIYYIVVLIMPMICNA